MQPGISLTLTNLTVTQASALLAVYNGQTTAVETVTAQTRSTKTTKPASTKKASAVVEDEDEEETVEEDDDTSVDDDDAMDAGADDESDDAPEYEDVIKAFKKFGQSFDDVKAMRKARAAILKKFKVESPTELQSKQYAAVIKALKVN